MMMKMLYITSLLVGMFFVCGVFCGTEGDDYLNKKIAICDAKIKDINSAINSICEFDYDMVLPGTAEHFTYKLYELDVYTTARRRFIDQLNLNRPPKL
jgi:hypothetical protein